MNCTLLEAKSDEDIRRCYAVMRELRPHVTEAEFLPRIRRQMAQGYRLIFAETNGDVTAAAGFRFFDMLAWGKAMYVDDLISAEKFRGGGFASKLIDWLIALARESECDQFHLDSGVHRHVAHRFYLHKGMDITSHHFAMKLK